MTVAQLITKLKTLPMKQLNIVMEFTTYYTTTMLPKKEQAEIADVHDGLDCDGGYVYKITEA